MLLLSLLTVGGLLLGGVQGVLPATMEMVSLNVALGATVVFPCDGSAHVGAAEEDEEEEGLFVWEAMGREVAAFKDGATLEGPRYKGRVRLAARDVARRGDWSLVLEGVTHDDVNMYECMVPGKRTLAIVWLNVDPPEGSTLWVSAWQGDSTFLSCEAPGEEAHRAWDLSFWWEKDGVAVEQDDARVRVETERNHAGLVISEVLLSDRGVYHCFYKASPSPETRRGSPEIVKLTVVGSDLAEDESAVTTATPWAVTTATPWAATITTATPLAITSATTNAATPSVTPTETTPDPWDTRGGRSSAVPSDTTPFRSAAPPPGKPPGPGPNLRSSPPSAGLPWVLISILAGVLSLTGITLCILGARNMI